MGFSEFLGNEPLVTALRGALQNAELRFSAPASLRRTPFSAR